MATQLALGCTMIALTTAIHAAFMVFGIGTVGRVAARLGRSPRRWVEAGIVSLFIIMFGASIVEVLLWALLFIVVGALSMWEEAVYFSAVTISTLGYGDIVLDMRWRLISSFEAINGIILFGWTTALVFAVVRRVYARDIAADPPSDVPTAT